MPLRLIGPHPLELDEQGQPKSRIATIFLDPPTLYTAAPPVHAWQRSAFIGLLNEQRRQEGRPALTLEEEEEMCARSVDLIIDPGVIQIRACPQRMDQAFAADALLQEIASKRQIVFLNVSDPRVKEAIKRHGEYWRLTSIPKTREGQRALIRASKVAIAGEPIYYYNRLTGIRWLTCREFSRLERLEDAALAAHLQEIAEHSIHHNRLGRPELDFFAADLRHFGARQFAGTDFGRLSRDDLRARFRELVERFQSAVHESFRADDETNEAWLRRMLSQLFLDGNEARTEEILGGLSPEFHMHVEWLPGGWFEEGEFIFDPVFEEAANRPDDADLQTLCDPRAKGIIYNFIREYGNLDYINLGRIPETLNLARPKDGGRRGVFIVELHSRGSAEPIKRFIRLQKWGVCEHLDAHKDLAQAVELSDEYTDYWLDRRLGCRQLGMNLPSQVIMRRLTEVYQGTQPRYRGQPVRTTYFERDYLAGIATDKIPLDHYARPGYGIKLAALLGRAAAPSLIVGRAQDFGARAVFDDGDEVVREGPDGLPEAIVLGDHSGSFADYQRPLEVFAAQYARPVNTRARHIPAAREFATTYLDAFHERFLQIQSDYRKRRRAFDTLFKHCKYDPGGSFAYRWECVLRRLDQTDAAALTAAIRDKIRVLHPGRAESSASLPVAD